MPRTSGTSSPAAANRERPTCRARTARATTPCTAITGTTTSPMMYFQDGRDRPRYCARHVVPLEELGSDLANPATTANFAWVAPDDCADMEGCGIAAGDEFLKTELTA